MSSSSKKLSPQQAATQQAFAHFDQDGDGFIGAKDLGSAMRMMGQDPTAAELSDLIDEVDPKRSGKIDYAGFVQLTARRIKNPNAFGEEVQEAFGLFDTDNKGFATPDEVRKVLATLGEKLSDGELDQVVRELDVDCDGKINYQDFMSAFAPRS